MEFGERGYTTGQGMRMSQDYDKRQRKEVVELGEGIHDRAGNENVTGYRLVEEREDKVEWLGGGKGG